MRPADDYDYEPLTREVAWSEVKRYDSGIWTRLVIGIVLAVVALAFLMLAIFFVIVSVAADEFSARSLEGFAYLIGIPAVLGIGLITSPFLARRQYRLAGFAHRNGFGFQKRSLNPDYPGMIFRLGRSKQIDFQMWHNEPPYQFEIGNYEYTVGSGRSSRTYKHGYLQMTLPRRVPHMVLDARANNTFRVSNLPYVFADAQKISLEGDFDQHFTLYAPKEYAQDALYVFTPDLMALLIDEGSNFDVELIDDRLFLYRAKPFRFDDPRVMHWMIGFVELMIRRFSRRTRLYRDDVIGDFDANLIAPGGARLAGRSRIAGLPVWAALLVAFGLAGLIVGVVVAVGLALR